MTGLLALALLVQTPDADTLQVREGLYIGVSIGPAMSVMSCAECPSDPGAEFGLQLQGGVGVALTPHLTLGLQLEGWSHEEGDGGFGTTAVALSWYPDHGRGYFIRPTVGLSSFRGVELDDGVSEKGSGIVAGLTVGQDIRFDRKLSLTPALHFRYADIGGSTLAGLPRRSNIRSWMVGLGVGLTWH